MSEAHTDAETQAEDMQRLAGILASTGYLTPDAARYLGRLVLDTVRASIASNDLYALGLVVGAELRSVDKATRDKVLAHIRQLEHKAEERQP